GPISFELVKRSGKLVLPAEDLARQALNSGHFAVQCCFGLEGNTFIEGASATEQVLETLDRD
ncbi:MAG TPA: hypothetical protein DIV39_12265, partial [Verrucomicrobiales bacterium]|nr:hypothetical protein [Verrucomicrobiales bacterium]